MEMTRHLARGRGGRPGAGAILLAEAFFAFLAAAVMLRRMPAWILALYALVSLMTFLIYAIDKRAARNGRQRISESTLHILTLTGGWPGAVLAQQLLRHKSQKQSYRMVFWATVILNSAVLGWVLKRIW